MIQTLSNPELLNIIMPSGETATGGSQDWYQNMWRRMSGCGPTTASNLIWYMTRTRIELHSLCDLNNGEKDSFVCLMNEMFTFIRPGMGGVNTSAVFAGGALKYGKAHGVTLTPHVLEIPKLPRKRPSLDEVGGFIMSALQANSPVAFLNLSNGSLKNLEAWHWVTIIGLDITSETGAIKARIADQGLTLDIDIAEWLKTSTLGGAMVWLS